MSDHRYPAVVRRLNDLLRSELGANPRYSWRWSEDLWHVMTIVDDENKVRYVEAKSPEGLTVMVPMTVRRKLLPFHENCWIVCALVEIDDRDGSLEGTGNHSWVPLSSSASGPVSLEQNVLPSQEFTQAVIDSVRRDRSKSATEMGVEWEAQQTKREKERWNRVFDEIRDASTAFANVPGRKGHVSYGGYSEPLVTLQ